MSSEAIKVEALSHHYSERKALDDVSFSVQKGEVFGLLGPNGGGKTTLFKILSTLIAPSQGEAFVGGASVSRAADEARKQLGVVFQKPSLDGKLSVIENLMCHGRLYRLGGDDLERRAEEGLERLGLAERADDLTETLSGGLQRRVELAKALLHRPPILLLDEPSTGLDPGARKDFLAYLRQLRDSAGVTVVLTTHYMEEAERCDRVAILHQGRIVRIGSPDTLKSEVGGDVVVLHTHELEALRTAIRDRFGCDATVVDEALRVETPAGHEFLRNVVAAFPDDVTSVTYGKPTLEDVFVHATGDRFWDGPTEDTAA